MLETQSGEKQNGGGRRGIFRTEKKKESISCSVVFDSAIAWTVALQAPLSMGFARQEFWSGLPCPPPGDLPHPGIEPTSLASPALAGGFFTH